MAMSTVPLARIESRSQGAASRLVSQLSIDLFESPLQGMERIHRLGIEMLRTGAFVAAQDHIARLAMAESCFVRSRTAQRVVLVHQHHDARGARDGLRFQPLRIS